jgi:predicted lysophospholipase L1 biosynthesis ABC-type transport system permease subunit
MDVLQGTLEILVLPPDRRHLVLNGKSYEVVGVAKNAKHGDLREPPQAFAYFPVLQSASDVHSLEVRTTVSPLAVGGDIRRLMLSVDPRLRIVDIETLEQRINQKLAKENLIADLAGFFAGLTLVLVVLGAYGTISYSAARRRKEIGIRIALGAPPANIIWMVLRHLIVAIAIGLIPGIAVAMLAGQLLAFLLFGLASTDTETIAGAGLILCMTMLTAAYLPVRRACRLDSATALRLE